MKSLFIGILALLCFVPVVNAQHVYVTPAPVYVVPTYAYPPVYVVPTYTYYSPVYVVRPPVRHAPVVIHRPIVRYAPTHCPSYAPHRGFSFSYHQNYRNHRGGVRFGFGYRH